MSGRAGIALSGHPHSAVTGIISFTIIQYFKKRLKLKDIEEQRYYAPQDKFDQENVKAHFKNGLLKIVVPALADVSEKEGFKVNISGEDE